VSYRYQTRVRYGECDQQGIVFNANYMAYMDDACEQWISSLSPGGYFTSLDLDYMVVRSVLEWRGSARSGDTLMIDVGIVRYGKTSFDVGFVATVGESVIFTARSVCVSVEPVTLQKCVIPERIRALLSVPIAMDVPS
jgi:acyl-CoA thioester hydrolase